MVEMLVAIAILGVLATLAKPYYMHAIRSYKVRAMSDDLIASIQWAKSEAIRRGYSVILIRTTNCPAVLLDRNDWSCGWKAVVDINMNGAVNANEPVLQVSTVPDGFGVMHTNQGPTLVITRWGQAQGVGQKFVMTPPEGVAGASVLTICITSGERIRKLPGEVSCT